jgi:hypothetical protein
MRHFLLVSRGALVALLLAALAGAISVQAAADPARVGANLSVPDAPAGFGYGVNFGNPSGWNNRGLATIAARAGSNTARVKLPETYFAAWGYDIAFSNGDMASYQSNGLTNLTGLLIGPTAAHSNAPAGGSTERYSPRNLYEPIWSGTGVVNPNNYWASYVYQTVAKYKGQVRTWEVWNEPDAASNWSSTQGSWWTSPPPKSELPNWNDSIFAYIRLLRVTYEVAKSVDPNCFVATGGIGYESFLDAILRYSDNPSDGSVTSAYPAKGGAWFDAVSYHHYPHFATYDQANQTWLRGTDSDAMATSFVARKNTLQMQLNRYGYDGTTYPKKAWLVTESGVSSKPAGGYTGSADLQRDYMLKMPILAQINSVFQVDWFQLADAEADSSAGNAYSHMGLYYDPRGKTADNAPLKPGAAAYGTFAATVRGLSYDQAATAALGLPANVRGYVFHQPDGRKAIALWAATSGNNESATATAQIPSSVSLEKRDWDYAVTKATQTLSPVGGKVTVALTAAPLFLIETTAGGSVPTSTPTVSPTSTPAPTSPPAATSTPKPSPTAPPVASPTPSPTAPPVVTPSPTASPTPVPTQTGGSASEHLLNGGFESGLANWFVPSWFASTASAGSTTVHGGTKGLQFKGNAAGPYAYQEVSVSSGQKVNFSGWMNVTERSGDFSMVVEMLARSSYNSTLATIPITTTSTTTNGWVQIAGSAVMPNNTAKVRVQIRFPKLYGTVYFDDLSVMAP